MKKLLFVLSALSMSAVASTAVVACSSGVKINDKVKIDGGSITLTVTAEKKNKDFLEDSGLISAVDAAFKASDDETIKAAVKDTDYTISVAKPDADQAAGPLEFTVKGKDKLSGSVKFTVNVQAGGGGGGFILNLTK